MNKNQEKLRLTHNATRDGVPSSAVLAVRERIPGLSLTDSHNLAKFEHGQLCDRNRDDVILALIAEVIRLSDEVKNLKQSSSAV